jgi:hypothetical protein
MGTAGHHHTSHPLLLLLLLLLLAAAVSGEPLVAGDCQQAILLLSLLLVVMLVGAVVTWGAHVHWEHPHWQPPTELHTELPTKLHWEFSVRALGGPAVCLLPGDGCSNGEGCVLLLSQQMQQQQQGEGVLQGLARGVPLMWHRCCLISCELAHTFCVCLLPRVLCCAAHVLYEQTP